MDGYSLDQGRELAAVSRLISRQIGILIDRQGKVEVLIVGDANSILIPALTLGSGRLRGLRLLHTHLNNNPLSHEDLMDLLFVRFDSIGLITVDEHGMPVYFQHAHLLPSSTPPETNVQNNLKATDIRDILQHELHELQEDKPYYVSELMPWDTLYTDLLSETLALEAEFARLTRSPATAHVKYGSKSTALQSGTRCVLVSVGKMPKSIQERNLIELAELARTAGLDVAGSLIQRVSSLNPRQILSQHKLAELEVIALQGHANVIIFDGELSPAQLQNVAEITERKVLDRTQLILDIFAQHAKSSGGKLQVEMAQLKYTQPRLAGKNRAMDRLMGGIGGRGPGETKLETDRRRVRDRIARIKNDLASLKKQRESNRAKRQRQELPVAALVGYTNAGKSTLLNALTKSEVIAENKLFATLDPTTRRLRFPEEHELVLADTVGFIRDLPKELKEAFQATLEELNDADLLIHVADASHQEFDQQLESVENILIELELAHMPQLLVLNKWDSVDTDTQIALMERFPKALPISALHGTGLKELTSYLWESCFVQ